MDDLIELVGAVDGILQVQAAADADYFLRDLRADARRATQARAIRDGVLARLPLAVHRLGRAGARFSEILGGMITPAQGERIGAALAPIIASVGSVELRMAA